MNMKPKLLLPAILVTLTVGLARGQGTLSFDQESSSDESVFPNGTGLTLQQHTQFGQSFTPSLSAVDFVRLNLNDKNPNNTLGAVLRVNLRTGAINGPILATTGAVSLTNGFSGVVSFSFVGPAQLAPGTTYFLEPIVQSGDQWNVLAGEYNYPGGAMFADGFQSTASDFWFREGVVVPEPSIAALLVVGISVWLAGGRHERR